MSNSQTVEPRTAQARDGAIGSTSGPLTTRAPNSDAKIQDKDAVCRAGAGSLQVEKALAASTVSKIVPGSPKIRHDSAIPVSANSTANALTTTAMPISGVPVATANAANVRLITPIAEARTSRVELDSAATTNRVVSTLVRGDANLSSTATTPTTLQWKTGGESASSNWNPSVAVSTNTQISKSFSGLGAQIASTDVLSQSIATVAPPDQTIASMSGPTASKAVVTALPQAMGISTAPGLTTSDTIGSLASNVSSSASRGLPKSQNATVAAATQSGTSFDSRAVHQPAGSQSGDSSSKDNAPDGQSNASASTDNLAAINLLQAIPSQANPPSASSTPDALRVPSFTKQSAPSASQVPVNDHGADISKASTDSSMGASPAVSPIAAESGATILTLPFNLPTSTTAIKTGDAVQNSIKPAGKKDISGATNGSGSDAKSSGTSSPDKSSDTGNSSHDASASNHISSSNGQPQKDTSANTSQLGNTPAASGSSTSQQQQASALPVVSHDLVGAHTGSSVSDTPVRTVDSRDVPMHSENIDIPATSNIDSAKLLQTMSASEMRVGMHSSEFGNISIRTTISQQQMVAQISVDHSDLSRAISSHLDSVQSRLGAEHGLNASIEINSQGTSSAADSGQSSPRQQMEASFSNHMRNGMDAEEPGRTAEAALAVNANNGNRLDIRA
ncbi:MAG TPA: hypothetical protein VHZ52_16535 [Acidobacteriaceae bacterium]|nr:hypothetical protein [Acidobacteriaceae bacterium]